MMHYHVFDVETIPLPDAELELQGEVKLGNLKDPLKIEARKLESQNRALEKAALSPLTGRIAAIGVLGPNRQNCRMEFGREEELITGFFDSIPGATWVGFNIAQFDLPFIVRRAWCLGLPVPPMLYNGRYMPSCFIDLAAIWKGSAWEKEIPSLERLGRAFGLGGKAGHGAHFAATLYQSEETARAYLQRDLELTWDIAMRMGVIEVEMNEHITEPDEEPDELNFW